MTPASSRMMPALVEVTSGLANSGLSARSGVEDCTAKLSTMIGPQAVRLRDLASHAPASRTATPAAAVAARRAPDRRQPPLAPLSRDGVNRFPGPGRARPPTAK